MSGKTTNGLGEPVQRDAASWQTKLDGFVATLDVDMCGVGAQFWH